MKSQLVTITKPSTYFLTMNVTKAPFNNPKVREAVSYAIDRNFLLKLINGQGSVANEFLPPGTAGYTPDKLVHDQDIAKAKQLLTAAGYPNGSHHRSLLVEHSAFHGSGPADPAGPGAGRDQGQREGRNPECIQRRRQRSDEGTDDSGLLGGGLPGRV